MRTFLPLLLIPAMIGASLLMAPANAPCRQAGWVPLESTKATPKVQAKPSPPRQKKKAVAELPAKTERRAGATVYDNQPPVTEQELQAFLDLLPRFRVWARSNGEEAHPVLSAGGQPDFLFSPKAAAFVENNNFDAARFFCIMGKMAAGMVIVEEGNDFNGTRPRDMPAVAPQELALVRKHLGELLAAGGPPESIK